MLTIENLTYVYPSGRGNVVDSFSLSLEVGKIYGLLGENGVGKTTLLGLMCGILRPTSGHVSFRGVEISKRDPGVLSQIYYLPDEVALPSLSLKTYVRVNSPFYPKFSNDALEKYLADFDMPTEIANICKLSLGQRKKVALSFALAAGTELLLMDEPTNGLDIPSKANFRKIVSSAMTDERTFVISTHQVHDVENLIDQVTIVDNRQILLNKSISEISEMYAFENIGVGANSTDAIYSEPTPYGVLALRRKSPDEDETQVNIELLFNAVTKGFVK